MAYDALDIEYGDLVIAVLDYGDRAVLKTKGMVMLYDIVVSGPCSGLMTYYGEEEIDECDDDDVSIIIPCAGQYMTSDIGFAYGPQTTTGYTTYIMYYLNGSRVSTRTVSSTTGYLTATAVSKSGATATVTLSDGRTNSHTYSCTLTDVIYYKNTSSGVISVYAQGPTTYIKYYLNGTLVNTRGITSPHGYVTATNVSKSGATATVTLSDGITSSYTYSSTLDSITYENTSTGVISVYATGYTTSIRYYMNDTLVHTGTSVSSTGYVTATAVSKSGATATVTLSDGSTNSYTYDTSLTSVTYENTSTGVISVYATATYVISIKQYFNGILVTTGSHYCYTASSYPTATNISYSNKTTTVTLSNGDTVSFTYAQSLTGVTYENTSTGVISVYATNN